MSDSGDAGHVAAEQRARVRGKVTATPPLDVTPLPPAPIEAINRVEQRLREQRYDRSSRSEDTKELSMNGAH